jgi:hypothetical protein
MQFLAASMPASNQIELNGSAAGEAEQRLLQNCPRGLQYEAHVAEAIPRKRSKAQPISSHVPRSAERGHSAAIDKHGEIDGQAFASKAAGLPISKKRRKAVERDEGRAHEAVSDALEALCKYRPRTPQELSLYILTLLSHWRIKDACFEEAHDRTCLIALLTNVNAATAALVFHD